jgi:alpha-N-arabinofuranosidase
MLEDRKFYYPIEGKEPYERMREGYDRLVASPWRFPHGSPARHIKDPYRDQPVIELRGLLFQTGLSTLAGRKYDLTITYKGAETTFELYDDPTNTAKGRVPKSSEWVTKRVTFIAKGSSSNSRLWIGNTDTTRIAAVSLMPADNIEGFRRDTIELLKELDAPIYRWPGGNFVSGYEWRDGIGDRDKRPTIPNPAWTGIDTNDVGTHEFIRLCELIGTEPLIVVNTGFGDPFSAAQWVEYCNSPPRTSEPPNFRTWPLSAHRMAARSPSTSDGGGSETRCTATGSSATSPSASTSPSTT